MNTGDLVKKIEELKTLSWDSPVVKLRIKKIKQAIADIYGDDLATMFENALETRFYSFEIEINQRNFFKRVDNAIDLVKEFENPL